MNGTIWKRLTIVGVVFVHTVAERDELEIGEGANSPMHLVRCQSTYLKISQLPEGRKIS
jgi:hypothetical protein